MKQILGPVITFAFILVIGFYTSFVYQHLWNWFLAPAMHIDPISYWAMYGVSMLVRGLTANAKTGKDEERWEKIKQFVELCVPDANKYVFDQIIKDEKKNLWLMASASGFGELIGSTVALMIGWSIYTFLI